MEQLDVFQHARCATAEPLNAPTTATAYSWFCMLPAGSAAAAALPLKSF